MKARHFGQGTPNGPIADIVFDNIANRLPILAQALGNQST